MTQEQKFRSLRKPEAFSLVEVVLALGVISFALIAILGAFPAGLSTQRSAQDDTRAAQIAGDILSSLTSQTQANWFNATINQPQPSPSPNFVYTVPLNRDYDYAPLGANYDGTLIANYAAGLPYQVTIKTRASPTVPPGFDSGYACEVIVRVAWQPFSQNYRDFARIVTRY
jgi:type II secretory pathway pseudopilin PulG